MMLGQAQLIPTGIVCNPRPEQSISPSSRLQVHCSGQIHAACTSATSKVAVNVAKNASSVVTASMMRSMAYPRGS